MESRSSINIGPNKNRNNMHASNTKEQPYHKKMYKRGLTNVENDRD